MASILLSRLSRRYPQRQNYQYQTVCTFVEEGTKQVRDRALDHAVEKEKHLKPLLALKNLIISEPSKSLPVSVASENKTKLGIPTRTIDFIRNYPSVFEEYLPQGGCIADPYVRLTPEVLHIDEKEQLIYSNPTHRDDIADRLLKLLMLARANKIPLWVIDMFQWDLGLPQDYVSTLLAEYPDYFRVTEMESKYVQQKPVPALELVCWSDELAKSVMEKNTRGYEKGTPIAFPVQYSRGYNLEKSVKKWLDEWQKLPYISPYENACHFQSRSDQADKWTVAVLHELLHLLVPKKTDKENILCLGNYLRLGSRFKRALMNHPGIFYVSSKVRTHTVILREGYKRDLLVKKHPLMDLRYHYIHLMNKGKEEKPIGDDSDTISKRKRISRAAKEGEEEEDEDDFSGNEAEDASDDSVDDDEDEDEDEDDSEIKIAGRRGVGRNPPSGSEMNGSSRSSRRASSNGRVGRHPLPGTDMKRPSRSSDRATFVGKVGRYPKLSTEKNRTSRSSDRDSSNGGKPIMTGERVKAQGGSQKPFVRH
ncbi:hypothetical protein MKW94_012261 [Papaver nudicaule]|uniref:PORR domain-containing protein n=1 Tax=Papaver nudicaule TaxID=74823 RepID=A0AA41SB59_PAPNU|nr:hypothetical protein [Papaver nudicaule]